MTLEEFKNEREILMQKWKNAERKLKRQIEKKESTEAVERAVHDMNEKWKLLEECHYKYMAHSQLPSETKEEEQKTFADLEDKQEDLFEEAKNTKKEIKDKMQMSASTSSVRADNKEVSEKRKDFQAQLGNIVVSRKAQQEYLEKLKENEIENWSETSQCKIIYGIDPDFYEQKFLGKEGLFQRASKVDDETLASFEIVTGAGGMSDQLKTFSSKPEKSGNKIGGKFGMYAAFRRTDGSNLIDVAYTVYNFDADLMGTGEKFQNWITNGSTEMGDKESLITRLKVGDIAALTENFIVSKALTAFAQSNVIEKVKWEEEEKILPIDN